MELLKVIFTVGMFVTIQRIALNYGNFDVAMMFFLFQLFYSLEANTKTRPHAKA